MNSLVKMALLSIFRADLHLSYYFIVTLVSNLHIIVG